EPHPVEAHQPVVGAEPEKSVRVLSDRPDRPGEAVLAAEGRERVIGEDVAQIDGANVDTKGRQNRKRQGCRSAGSLHDFRRGRLSRLPGAAGGSASLAIITSVDLMIATASSPRRNFNSRM